eukprot:m.16003 g.16003  ORF g.16003 m.16003 type:complete len:176 (+) comp5560_c0_seq2:95-622(+)
MVRLGSFKHVFEESWENVTIAHWNKYPNPKSDHVLFVDTISRSTDAINGCMSSVRVLIKKDRKPQWMQSYIKSSDVCIVENSVVDPKQKIFTTYSRNINYQTLMMVEEKCTYKVSQENSNWTSCSTEARVTSQLFIAPLVESFGIGRFMSNAKRAKVAVDYVIGQLRQGGLLFKQ